MFEPRALTLLLTGSALTALSALRAVPQMVRALRHRDGDGVSLASWAMASLAAALWVEVAVLDRALGLGAANAVALVPALVVLGALTLGVRARAARLALATTVLATVAGLGLAALAPGALSVAAIVATSISYLPQALAVARARDLTGVSIPTWALSAVNAVLWVIYAAALPSLVVALPSVLTLPTSLYVIARCRRARRPRTATPLA